MHKLTNELKNTISQYEDISERLNKLKDSYKGETCYIVSAGPSLKNYQVDELKNKLKDSKEFFVVRNCQMTANNITLSPDGTQEQSVEFTSMVAPLIRASVADGQCDLATDPGDI